MTSIAYDNDPGTGRRENPAAGPVDQTAPENRPDFTRPEVTELGPKRERCRDLMAGTDAIHAKTTTYLPKWGGEEEDTYRIRATLTELYNGFGRCVTASVGMVHDKPPELAEDANPEMQEHWTDIDAMGTAALVFLRDQFREGLLDGIVGGLVEYPKVANVDTRTVDDVQKKNQRPRWIPYCADQIINWRFGKVNNRIELTLLVLHEAVDEDVGAFGTASVEQYRVLNLTELPATDAAAARTTVVFKVWRKTVVDNKVIWTVHEEGEMRPQTSIPFGVGYLGVRVAPNVALPPLIDLADLNLGHYRVSADRRYMLSICLAPTFCIEGNVPAAEGSGAGPAGSAPGGAIKLGPNAFLQLMGTQKASWVQADPDALEPAKAEKDDLIAQMGAMAIAFMAQERKAQETATAHTINMRSQNASLSTAAQGMKDYVDQMLKFHGIYLGIAPENAPTVTYNVSYDEQALDAPTISALDQLAKDNNLTRKTLLLILQRGRIIPEEVDIDEEELSLLSTAVDTVPPVAGDLSNPNDPNNAPAPAPKPGVRPAAAVLPSAPAASPPIEITIPLTVNAPGAPTPQTIVHKFERDASGNVTGGTSKPEGAAQ